MTNFEKKLEEATNEELMHWINDRNPHYTVLASDELTRRSLKETNSEIQSLNKTIKKANKTNEKFTFILVIVAIIQLVIAFFQLLVPFFFAGSQIEVWKGVVIEAILVGAIVFIFWRFGLLEKKK